MNNEVPTPETEQSQRLNSCEAELAAYKEKYSYLAADFENYRRNQERERFTMAAAFQSKLLQDLLQSIDDFERALSENQSNTDKQQRAGFELVYKNLRKLLTDYGVTEITEHLNFDPHIHEALLHVQAEGKQPGEIVAVLRKGYRFKGQILRPAQVSVAA